MANGAINRRRAGRPGPPQPGDNERRGRLNGKRQRQPCVGEDDPVLPNPGWVTQMGRTESSAPTKNIVPLRNQRRPFTNPPPGQGGTHRCRPTEKPCPSATNDALFPYTAGARAEQSPAPTKNIVPLCNQRRHFSHTAGARAEQSPAPTNIIVPLRNQRRPFTNPPPGQGGTHRCRPTNNLCRFSVGRDLCVPPRRQQSPQGPVAWQTASSTPVGADAPGGPEPGNGHRQGRLHGKRRHQPP